MSQEKICFDYAFAAPHTMTLCRPSASEKYLVNVEESRIQFLYSFESQKNVHPLSWTPQAVNFETELSIRQDGETFLFDSWKRHCSGAPWLVASGGSQVTCSLDAVATKCGVIVRTVFENKDERHHDVTVKFHSLKGWVISNLGWIDYEHNNLLLTMNNGRADRIIAFAEGADDYPMFRNGVTQVNVPMPDIISDGQGNSMMYMTSLFSLEPGEKKIGYIVLPFESYQEEYETLRRMDFDKEMEEALEEWCTLLDQSVKISICDEDVIACYRACLADLFVMREPVGDRHGIVNGTQLYRSASSGEPLLATIVLDRAGYTQLAYDDLPLYLEGQEENGCWAYSKGWEHESWGVGHRKGYAALEHYYLTRNLDYLKDVYVRMKRSTLFNHACRVNTKNAPKKADRGLMPRGMGDCGMMDNGDFYGVFYPHNCMAVSGDKLTLKAAQILGYEEDVKILTEICEEAASDLVVSLRENSVREEDYEWIPSVAGAEPTSMYGCLFAYHPAGLLSAEDPLIEGTIRHVLSKRISQGGLPLGTGWLADGIWAAMAMDNFSSAFLRMGRRDEASAYLYPVLNHASPLVTWCEERGEEKNSPVRTGDMQHLWTPLSVCEYMLDALLYEDEEEIHICAGIPRSWLAEGKTISVEDLCTHCGKTSFRLENRCGALHYEICFEYSPEKTVRLHFRSPERDDSFIVEELSGVLG